MAWLTNNISRFIQVHLSMQLVCQVFVCLRFSRLLVVRALSSAIQETRRTGVFRRLPYVCQVVLWTVAVGGAAQVISGAVRLGSTDGSAARLVAQLGFGDLARRRLRSAAPRGSATRPGGRRPGSAASAARPRGGQRQGG